MKRYLVTGGAGFIGSTLCRKLLSNGNSVICLDDLSTGKKSNISSLEKNDAFLFLSHDLTKPFFPDQIDGIFNLACPASPVHYQYNPIRTLKMGTLAMYNVLGMAAKFGVPIVQASTSEVYGDPKEHPQKESYWGNVNPVGPRACYDEGKRVAESLCTEYRKNSGVDSKIARIFNTYGPYMSPDDGRVVSNFITQCLANQPMTVYGDGRQTRSFCFVDDLVNGLIKLMQSDFNNPINLGNPEEVEILELCNIISELLSVEPQINFLPLPQDDPVRRCPDINLANVTLNWKPTTNLKKGLIPTIQWFKEVING